jgi:hypothetical protein
VTGRAVDAIVLDGSQGEDRMAEDDGRDEASGPPPGKRSPARALELARRLRENLKRRKQQARARVGQGADAPPEEPRRND